MTDYHKSCSVLVVGSGGAALRAAISACDALGCHGRVAIATKGRLGASGVTANASSDRMAVHATLSETEPGGPDNWTHHARDIYEIGGFVSDADLACILARGSAQAFNYLLELGVPFVTDALGKPKQFVTDGSEYARACFTGPNTAIDIEMALASKVLEISHKDGLDIYEGCSVVRLITDSRGWVRGAYIADENGVWEMSAGAVILATGGAGGAFKVSAYPDGMTGDGYALAYMAGAQLVNMEFIQIGLTSRFTSLACSGSLMRCIPRLVDEDGTEILHRHIPFAEDKAGLFTLVFNKGATWPVSYEHRTHLIDVAVYKEMMRGRKLFLDLATNPEGFEWEALDSIHSRYNSEMRDNLGVEARKKSPLARLLELNHPSVEWLAEKGIRLTKGDLIEVVPAVQHFQGGITIGPDGSTTVRGLYACGEVAGGQHGANRPGGNALMDCQVFGEICGRHAAHHAMNISEYVLKRPEGETWRHPFMKEDGIDSIMALASIQDICYECAGVVRTQDRLLSGLKRLAEVAECGIACSYRTESGRMSSAVVSAAEACSALIVGLLVLSSAAAREESRGPHLLFESFDHAFALPRRDPEWQLSTLAKCGCQQMGFMPKISHRKPIGLFDME